MRETEGFTCCVLVLLHVPDAVLLLQGAVGGHLVLEEAPFGELLARHPQHLGGVDVDKPDVGRHCLPGPAFPIGIYNILPKDGTNKQMHTFETNCQILSFTFCSTTEMSIKRACCAFEEY